MAKGSRDEGGPIRTALERLKDLGTWERYWMGDRNRNGWALASKGEPFEFFYAILDHEHTTCVKLLDLSQRLQWVLHVGDWRRSESDDVRTSSGIRHYEIMFAHDPCICVLPN